MSRAVALLDETTRLSDCLVTPHSLSSQEQLRTIADFGLKLKSIHGYNWLPFTRRSDSQLVPFAAFVDSALRPGRLYRIIPKHLMAAGRY